MNKLDFFSQAIGSAGSAAFQLNVKSALNPILWALGIITVPSIIVSLFATGGAQVALIILAFVPAVTFVISYLLLLFRDPDKLQSEHYQIQKKTLDLIEQKGEGFQIKPISIEAISRPQYEAIQARKRTSTK